MSKAVSIGGAARASGVKVPTIRYYEQVGLLETPDRTEGGRRVYGVAEIERLAFIRHARELGFEVDAIRTLVALQHQPNKSCAEADGIARQHLAEVERRIASLMALKDELAHMVDGCSHGRINQCHVIEI